MTPEEKSRSEIKRLQNQIAETPTTDKSTRSRLREELNNERRHLLTVMLPPKQR